MIPRMTKLRSLRQVLAVVIALLLAATVSACGDDSAKPASGDDKAKVAGGSDPDDETPEVEDDADSDLPSDDDIEAYVKAISERELGALEDALALAEPGSVAEAYVIYSIAVVDAALAAGFSQEDLAADDLNDIDGGWRICDEPDDCNDVTDFEGRPGKIVNYLVDGEEITDRIIVGTGEPVPAGDFGTVTLRAAYELADEETMVVVVDVTSGDGPIEVADYNSSYRGTDGRQYTPSDSFGGDEFGANSTTTVALPFPSAELGGDVTLELQNEDYDSQTSTLPIN